MIPKIFLGLCLLLGIAQSINLLYLDKIPVDKLTLFKAILSLGSLQTDLDTNFGKPTQNNVQTFIRTVLTETYLSAMNDQLKGYNNIVVGDRSDVVGTANFILGDDNHVKGSQNWVFSQGFNGQADKDIILDRWMIDIDKTPKILTTPNDAIHKW
jgi:hypothetical protein